MGNILQFYKNQNLEINGIMYCVTGGIELYNKSDGSRWIEYCLRDTERNQVKWLSIDNMYEEYAIYTQCSYDDDFNREISCGSYRQSDTGNAAVIHCFGNVDTEPGDKVRYTEYEDSQEEYILSVEQWEDETEYSRGCYLDREDIISPDLEPIGMESDIPSGGDTVSRNKYKQIAVMLALAGLVVFTIYFMKPGDKSIHKFLKETSAFVYRTSITSDLNSKEKADVYTTTLTVDNAVKDIIRAIDGETEDVQRSEEEDSVAILTKSEYCLIYTNTEQITTVQICSRSYVYQSTNTPYHATHRTQSYYRSFYYSRGFWGDKAKYKKYASGYENYNGDTLEPNSNDPYKSFSQSVRQSSINSRKSSGGGISSGK